MAKILKRKKDIRVISLGTGEEPLTQYGSADELNIFGFMRILNEFIIIIDTYTSDFYLLNEFAENGKPQNYLRMQTTSNVGMDKIDQKNID